MSKHEAIIESKQGQRRSIDSALTRKKDEPAEEKLVKRKMAITTQVLPITTDLLQQSLRRRKKKKRAIVAV